ncbi:hypothetical protein [Halocynthiibacter styelae]|uniref:Uncharacterized protein n=1 Tax=Halocynthiibacter styelae TaxID=2761955 RepID=A0A8J7J8B3_9RHOB|nr:hypothetical protein [Paenihalocynthiibacter styelae]MBI1495195.1 hypothetical protein [Paenihalocynthiibacter styelae]
MTEHSSQITFVRPGGVATQAFADGAATMRICLGYLHDPDDGVLAEMKAKHDPVPWQSAQVRDDAIMAVETRADLNHDTRARLLEWIAATPYFEDT